MKELSRFIKRNTRRKRESVNSALIFDKNERFVLRKCISYLQRHLRRYPVFDRETLEFICWVLGKDSDQLAKYLLSQLKGNEKDKFEEELLQCDRDPDDYSRIFRSMVNKLIAVGVKGFNLTIQGLLQKNWQPLHRMQHQPLNLQVYYAE